MKGKTSPEVLQLPSTFGRFDACVYVHMWETSVNISCCRNKTGILGWRSEKTEIVNGHEAKVNSQRRYFLSISERRVLALPFSLAGSGSSRVQNMEAPPSTALWRSSLYVYG